MEKNKSKSAQHEADAVDKKPFRAESSAQLDSFGWDVPVVYGEGIVTIKFPHQYTTPVKPVIEALMKNSTVHTITFIQRSWDQQELKLLVECLARHNTGIKSIVFDDLQISPSIMEALVKILKSNPRIKSLSFFRELPINCFDRFCDGLEYFHLQSLSLERIQSTASLRKLTEGLRWNPNLTELSLNHVFTEVAMFDEICNGLMVSPAISSFKFSWAERALWGVECQCLAKVLKNNKLKQLTLKGDSLSWPHLAQELKTSTTLESLTVQFKTMDFKLFGEIITTNKSIKRLCMDHTWVTERDVLDLHLENTNLEQLSLNSWALSGATIFQTITYHPLLRSLTIGATSNLDVVGIQEFLKENKTLQELIIAPGGNTEQHTCTYIANGLKGNSTLRKLSFDMSYQDHKTALNFIKDLKTNDTLTYLNMGQIRSIGQYNRYAPPDESIIDAILDVLKVNKTLRHIESAQYISYLEAILKQNRDEQDLIIENTCLWIKMILTKPNSFVLPVEVWANIFKYTSYSFVPFDFEKYFKGAKLP